MSNCFGCINDGSQGSDYSDCWKCKNNSFYEEDDEFTEIKKQIKVDTINAYEDEIIKYAKLVRTKNGYITVVDLRDIDKVAEQLKGVEQ